MNDDRNTQPRYAKDDGATVQSVAADIRAAATQKFDETVTEVRTRADGAKDGVANEVNDVAMALRRASEELRGGSAQERTLGTIASSLADASDSIRDKDLGEITQMLRGVARDNPTLFLGGAALLGFAASRYAKASATTENGSGARTTSRNTQTEIFGEEGYQSTPPLRTAP